MITGRVIFTLNPAPGLFLEAFSFSSSSRFVQGTTPPKKKGKNPSRFPGIQERLSRVAAGISGEDNSLDYWCSQAARPLKPHLRGPESRPGASLGRAGRQHAPMLHFSCLNSRFFLRISKVPAEQGLGSGFEHSQQSLSMDFVRFLCLYRNKNAELSRSSPSQAIPSHLRTFSQNFSKSVLSSPGIIPSPPKFPHKTHK